MATKTYRITDKATGEAVGTFVAAHEWDALAVMAEGNEALEARIYAAKRGWDAEWDVVEVQAGETTKPAVTFENDVRYLDSLGAERSFLGGTVPAHLTETPVIWAVVGGERICWALTREDAEAKASAYVEAGRAWGAAQDVAGDESD